MNRRQRTTPLVLILLLLVSAHGAETDAQSDGRLNDLAPGLVERTLIRGSTTPVARFRVIIGAYDQSERADEALARVEATGLPASAHFRGGRYYVSVGTYDTRREAEETVGKLASLPLPAEPTVQEYGQDVTNPDGPWEIHVLEADPELVDVEVAHAYDAAIGLETLSSLVRRRGALAGINGGYYLRTGMLRGDSQGILQIQGTLLSEPDRCRAAVGFYREGTRTRAVFGRLGLRSHLMVPDGERIEIRGVNRRRGNEEVVLYTPEFHRTTLTPPGGAEVVVQEGRVESIHVGRGSAVIPAGGFVISLSSDLVEHTLPRFRVGQTVALTMELEPLSPDPRQEWTRARFVLGGGPLLLLGGRRIEAPETESIPRVFFLSRHPRTAAGVRADGTLLFFVVDGRRPETSVGMSLRELTDLCIELGAVSAVNLDGGGSSTMVAGGALVNSPSDPMGERETATAILLFPRNGPNR